MSLAFDFHPEAQAEFAADVDWYDDREVGVGGRSAEAVGAAIDATVDARAWQQDRHRPPEFHVDHHVFAGQLHSGVGDHLQPPSVPFPWYY